MISATLLSLVTGLVLLVYAQSNRISRQTDQQATFVADAQVAVTFIKQAIRESNISGCSAETNTLCLLSPRDSNGDTRPSLDGRSLQWSSYRLFYRSVAERTILRRIIDIPVSSPLATSAQPLESADLGTGVQPLASYASDGRVLLKNVEQFDITLEPTTKLISVVIRLSTVQGSGRHTSSLEISTAERCRN